MLGLLVTPAIALYVRFLQHESWVVVGIVAGALIVLFAGVAVWGGRMNGKAIELTDEGIAFARMWSRPELVEWSWIESDIRYLGGRRRKIDDSSILELDKLYQSITAERAKRKQ